ncbi:hypothetical protein TNCV_4482091 [Trichonephila clavipes]|nr:hypothetical protein TNCV_4482091 [Trichonephila clavipes]
MWGVRYAAERATCGTHARVFQSVLQIKKRAIGDGLHNFEQQSSDEDDTLAGFLSLIYHITPTRNCFEPGHI